MKILIIRFGSIGDIILTSPVIRALNNQLGAEVHFVCKSKFLELIRFNPHISKSYGMDNGIFELIPMLKNEKYDLVIDLHRNIRSCILRLCLRVPVITYRKMNLEKIILSRLGIDLIQGVHQVDRYFSRLGKLGVQNDDLGLEHFCNSEFQSLDRSIRKFHIVLSTGASKLTKRIPFSILDQLCHMNKNCHFWIIGGNDVEYNGEFETIDNSTVLIGKLNLDESAALIRDCDLVLTGDSWPLHMACAYQKALVVVWGSTSAAYGYYPYRPKEASPLCRNIEIKDLRCRPCSAYGRHSCPKGHMDCLNRISANQISFVLNELLN